VKVGTHIEIPKFLSHLETYGGYPVPFVAKWIDGKPDFRVVDPEKIERCVNEKLCAICGVRLGEFCWFIGGELCKANGLFVDPAMHEHCTEFSTRACAFLSGKKPEYSNRPVDETVVRVEHMAVATRPKQMYLFKSRTKKFRFVQLDGSVFIQSGPWSRVTELEQG
jgi:hypothetical protein